MQYKIEKNKSQVNIEFDLNTKEWELFLNKSYGKNKYKYKIDGFRKGFAPRKIIEQQFGKGVFFNGAIESCYFENYEKIINEEKLQPIETPNIDIKDINDKGTSFIVSFHVRPEVELQEYKHLGLKKNIYEVTEDDIKNEIDKLKEKNAVREKIIDREAKNEDIVIIDYSGSIDGKIFPGGTATMQELILGSKTFIEGFEEQVIGMKIGEEKDINVVFPQIYHDEKLAGKKAVFHVKLHEIYKRVYPKLDDKFAKDVSKYETLEELKKNLREELETNNNIRAENEFERIILEKVVHNAKVEIPECMVKEQLDLMLGDLEYKLNRQGIKLTDYFKYTGTTQDEYKNQFHDEALNIVKTKLVIEEIIKKENIKASDKDVDGYIEKFSKGNKALTDFNKQFNENVKNKIKSNILYTKVIEFLKNNNDKENNEETKKDKQVEIDQKKVIKTRTNGYTKKNVNK